MRCCSITKLYYVPVCSRVLLGILFITELWKHHVQGSTRTTNAYSNSSVSIDYVQQHNNNEYDDGDDDVKNNNEQLLQHQKERERQEERRTGGFDMIENRIVGGVISNAGTWPFFVLIHSPNCGGSLVAEDVVMTAAHCGRQLVNAGTDRVLVGATKRNTETSTSQWRMIKSKLFVHPNFGVFTQEYDFMLFKIEKVTKPGLVPVRLNNNRNIPATDEWVTAMGMGYYDNTNTNSDDLRQVPLQVETTEQCNAKNVISSPIDPKIFMCLSVDEGGKNICSGDSGSPVISSSGVLLGHPSYYYGTTCGDNANKYVYARVSSSYDWITETICRITDTNPSFCPSPWTETKQIDYKTVLAMKYDKNPLETGVKVLDYRTKATILNIPKGKIKKEFNRKAWERSLEMKKTYRVKLFDANGFNGAFSVLVKDSKTGNVKWSYTVSGNFKKRKRSNFKIPKLPGSTCTKNTNCSNGPCVKGVCQASKVPSGGTCDDDRDCITGGCAHLSDNKKSRVACCVSGFYYKNSNLGSYPWFCASRLGDKCSATSQCDRGFCTSDGMGGLTCQPVPDGGSCTRNSDCWSGQCVGSVCS